MKVIAFISALFVGSVVAAPEPEQLFHGLPADVTPELSSFGQSNIGVQTIDAHHANSVNPMAPSAEGRVLTLEVWYPTSIEKAPDATYQNQTRSGIAFNLSGNAVRDAALFSGDSTFPLVVISHGYTGYRTIMFHLAEHLASHGYVVVGIDHTDSTNEDIDFATAPFAGFLSTLVNRAKDQQFVLDWMTNDSPFSQLIDDSAVGLMGYSMGGYGAINTIGGCFAFTEQHIAAITGSDDSATNSGLASMINQCHAGREEGTDPRWQAAVLLAPWGGNYQVFSPDSLANIKVPSLYIAGDLDDISGYAGIRWLFEGHSSGAQLLTYQNARHNIGPHPAPQASRVSEIDIGHYHEGSWDSEVLAATNQHFTLAMMNCHLKKQQDACTYLAVRGSSNQTPENGEPTPPWYGFDHRYSTGMKMEASAE